jgi:hypothetical protein
MRMPVGDSPVEIVAIKVKAVTIEPGHKFTAEDDWLNGLTFTLKNVSDKPIVYADVELLFPAPSGSQVAGAVYELRYGRNPIIPNTSTSSDTLKAIMPGESLDLTLSESELQSAVSPF